MGWVWCVEWSCCILISGGNVIGETKGGGSGGGRRRVVSVLSGSCSYGSGWCPSLSEVESGGRRVAVVCLVRVHWSSGDSSLEMAKVWARLRRCSSMTSQGVSSGYACWAMDIFALLFAMA
jgi:hypothetical protein